MPAIMPPTVSHRTRSSGLTVVVLVIGFTAVAAQVVLMRELIVVFQGNELSLGVMLGGWLLWTAFGSFVVGRIRPLCLASAGFLAGLQVALAFALPLTIFAIRSSKVVLVSTPGELVALGPMLLVTLAVLSFFCVTAGALFTVASQLHAATSSALPAEATSSVYLIEAAGSALGGLSASLLLIRHFDAFRIAMFLALLNLGSAIVIPRTSRIWRAVVGYVLVLAAGLGCQIARDLEGRSLARLWRGSELVTTRNSVYGNLAVVQANGSRSIYESGLIFASAPDPINAEESVHFALLEHRSPRSLLLIGGGVSGALQQALQHTGLQRVDYVELDPVVLELANRFFRNEWLPARNDPRAVVHALDGRLYMKTTLRTFDVVILNLPDPQTAQLNRFYTAEFFRQVAIHLNPGGIFSFQLRGSENYIGPELAEFLRCVHKTLRITFPYVTLIPGDNIHFFASNQAGVLATTPQDLLSRLHERDLKTEYVREYYIPFRMAPDRVQDLEEQIRVDSSTPVNRDFAPVAYYFGTALWSRQFTPEFRKLFQAIAQIRFIYILGWTAVLVAAATLAGSRITRTHWRLKFASGFSTSAMGATLIALEIFLLLGFQALYGYVYQQLSIIIAAFMAGMAAGSWGSLRESRRQDTAWKQVTVMMVVQLLAALSPLLLYVIFLGLNEWQASIGTLATNIVIPLLAFLAGALGGFQFPLASGLYFAGSHGQTRGMGSLYALDLFGSCAAALLVSSYLVPVFGFLNTAGLFAILNLGSAVSLWTSLGSSKRVSLHTVATAT